MNNPFSTLPKPAPDPIFSIALEARKAGPEAIDATAGVYMGEDGTPHLLPSVSNALREYGTTLHEEDISYPPLLGLPGYRKIVEDLVFGASTSVNIASIATTGGTGALAVNLRLMKQIHSDITIILPTPAWANHMPLCKAANTDAKEVPCIENGEVTEAPLVRAIQDCTTPSAVLLQAGCHNPTGRDFSLSQLDAVLDVVREKECMVLMDFAYQGFAGTPEKDAMPIQRCIDANVPLFVTWSASKNHGLYGLRTGLACAVAPDKEAKTIVENHYSMISRGLHSSAPVMGQAVVEITQKKNNALWLNDLQTIRDTLQGKRKNLAQALPEQFTAPLMGTGMFALLPLTIDQIRSLRTQHKVFMTEDGRINIGGIPMKRIDELAAKILQVI